MYKVNVQIINGLLPNFFLQEKELERWKHRVKDLESENFIKEQTIRQFQEQAEVRTLVRPEKFSVNYFPRS